jgi:RNA polymerase sigma-70 factor (ECF subfamily)
MKTHNRPQTPAAPVESCAEMQIVYSVVQVERTVSAAWPRSSGKGGAPVSGIKRCALTADEKQTGEGVGCDASARLIPLKEGSRTDWRQQTLHLYDALAPKLVKFLRHLGLDREEREDVIQEVFLRLARHLKKGNSEDNLHSWVHQVAHNLAMDVHRVNRRGQGEVESEFEPENEPVDPKANPELVYLEKERSSRLKTAMSQLTKQQHNSILLRIQGWRYRDIGELLGISEQRAIHLVKPFNYPQLCEAVVLLTE